VTTRVVEGRTMEREPDVNRKTPIRGRCYDVSHHPPFVKKSGRNSSLPQPSSSV